MAEGGSDWRKEVGEEGGAMKGSATVVEGFKVWVLEEVAPSAVTGSGNRTALLILLPL